MPKPLFKPDGDTADEERGGAALLARTALGAPAPRPQAEQESRERVLAEFQAGPLSPRSLHKDGADSPAPTAWTERMARVLRRIMKR